ncbi:MAG: hydrogenase-4 component E [Acetobacteraceae bacterium]
MRGLYFDVAHMLAGFLVLLSFLMLYQVRLLPLLHVLAAHAFVLALSVAWQAHIQHAPHLYITAAIALIFKAIIVPIALRRMVFRMGIHREIETVVSIGLTMLAGMALVALSLEVMLPLTVKAEPVVREDIALALSVVLIGLLMMVTRRNAVSQVVGFMSLENGINLAATGAQGMPLVVEISVAFRERFDTVDVGVMDEFRGGRQ